MKLCKCGCGKEIKEGNEFIKGHYLKIKQNNPNYNKHLSQETKDKISKSRCGKCCGNNNINYGGLKEETKNKISETLIERYSIKNHPMYGRHHSEESKKKSSQSHKNLPKEVKQKCGNAMRGKHHSKETKQKMHKSAMGRIPSPKVSRGKWCYYFSPLQGRIRLRSSYELAYAKYLDSKGISWYYEYKTFLLDNTTYTPDFYLPNIDEYIEIKGYMSNKAQEKISDVLKLYNLNLRILKKNDLINLGIKIC